MYILWDDGSKSWIGSEKATRLLYNLLGKEAGVPFCYFVVCFVNSESTYIFNIKLY